jgi:hypothetical protein
MATRKRSRKRTRSRKGCRIVKGGGCLCGRKFAKRTRCGKAARKTSRKRRRR